MAHSQLSICDCIFAKKKLFTSNIQTSSTAKCKLNTTDTKKRLKKKFEQMAFPRINDTSCKHAGKRNTIPIQRGRKKRNEIL